MTSDKNKLRRPMEPPLVREERTEIDPDIGAEVTITTHRRGVLGTESREIHSPLNEFSLTRFHELYFSESPRQLLEKFCDGLRDRLEASGFPSDRTPSWVRCGEGEWQPRPEDHRGHQKGHSYARWISRVEKLTEPLSPERAAGALLLAIIDLLNRVGIEEHLWHILQVMQKASDYRITGSINYLAYQGVLARKARSAGPKARQSKAKDMRRIIWAHAEQRWSRYGAMKGDASNTAAAIAGDVNSELRAQGLLPPEKAGLSVKTIGDHIRAGFRG